MTINHRAEAERHLATAARHLTEHPSDMRIAEVAAWIGQGYATLARNEEQAATTADMRDANTKLRRDLANMRRIIVDHIADGLTRRELYAWRAANDTAKELDGASLNIDREVDQLLEDRGVDPKRAWTCPTDHVDPDTKTWTDLAGTVWDLTKTWVDSDGKRWTWTGGFDQGPEMKQVGSDFVTSLDAISVFSSPLTPADHEQPPTP